MKKRILSAIMAAMMVMFMVPTNVFASVVRVEDAGTLWDEETDRFRICSDNYWADIVTEQPTETEYVVDASAKTVRIYTPEALVWFGKEVNKGKSFAEYTITIEKNLDLSGYYWTPIDTATIDYEVNGDTVSWKTIEPTKKLDNVTIDGGGHTITGLTTATGVRGPAQPSVPGDGQNCYYYSAFIGRNDGTLTIENLTFDGASIAITEPADGVSSNGTSMCAVVAALNTGELTLDAVTVSDSRVLAMQKAAALLGMPNTGSSFTVNQCAVTGCTISAYYQTAPVVGYASQDDVSIQGVRLEDNTVRVMEQQGEDWAYKTDESGNQYYSYQDSVWTLNAGEVAVFHNGEADSTTTDGSVPSMVASVGGYEYDSLTSAWTAALDQGTAVITLLQDVEEQSALTLNQAGANITVNLNNHNIYFASSQSLQLFQGNLTLTGTGIVSEKEGGAYYGPVMVYGNRNTDVENTCVLNVNSGVTLRGWAPIFVNGTEVPAESGRRYANGVVLNVNGATLDSVVDRDNYGGHCIYVQGTITDPGNYPLQINLTGAKLTATSGENGDGDGMYLAGYAVTTITNSTITAGEEGTGIEIRAGKLTINGDTAVTGGSGEVATYANGNGLTTDNVGLAVAQHTTNLELDVTINGGTFGGSAAFIQHSPQNGAQPEKVNITINGGSFASTETGRPAVYSQDKTGFIYDGYFSSDPSEYAATGYAAVSSDDPDYAFMVAEAADTDVAPATGDPAVDDSQLGDLTQEQKQEVMESAASVEAEGGELAAAANGVVGSVEESQVSAAKSAYKASGIDGASEVEDDAIYIYAQTYQSITPTEYDATAGTLTLDIQPMYRVVASVVNDADQIDVEGENQNAVVLAGSEKELNNIQRMTITITLPSGFAEENDTVYIQHKGYEYSATADSSGNITFTNPHGFSEFKFSKTTAAVAQIGDTRYTDLQNAVNAVENDETITLLADGQSATVSRAISFTVESVTGQNYTANITPGSNYSMTYDESTHTYTFTYSGGGGSSGTTRYTVTVEDSANGEVSSSHSRASRGTTVTLTITPGDGYVLDELVVTDANGDELDLTRKSSSQYTFTMPRSRVTVEASFVEGEEPGHDCPSEDYDDLSTSAWYHSAVDYVLSEGMMSGVSQYEFAPDDTLTRAMVVQILWAMEGRPQVNYLMQYDDVSESAWYAEAVRWGVSEGIVSGYSESTFGPEDPVTREQLALILYNYARSAGYDADEGGTSILEYNDYDSISAWALEAMEWSVNAGLISGKDGSRLDPAGTATRAEAAQMLMNLDLLLSEV